MKVVFIYTGEEYLGIEYLSAVLRKNGHRTFLFYDPRLFNDYYVSNSSLERIFSFQAKIIKKIIHLEPDLIAFSVNSPEYAWALSLAHSIKKAVDIPVVFGGHHPTCSPEEVINNNFVDFVIQGEGEYALLDLVRHLDGKVKKEKINNLYYKLDGGRIHNIGLRPFIENLDDLPFPDKELFYSQMPFLLRHYTIMASRGCPYSCSYCHNGYLKKLYNGKGQYVRTRSIKNVTEELKERKKIYKMKGVMFQDEIFTLDFEWLKEFSTRYKKEIGLPYACYVHPDTVDSKMADLLHSSGCVSVNMGIESIDENLRKELLHRTIPQSQILNALMLFKKNRIYCRAYFLIGLPGQKEEDIIKLARFCSEHRFGSPLVFWIHYFPKTEIAENRKIEGQWLGYTREGDTFNILFGKLKFLIFLTPLFAQKTIDYIIQKRIYRLFPSRNDIFYLLLTKFLLRIKDFLQANKKNKKIPKIASLPILLRYRFFMLKRFFQ